MSRVHQWRKRKKTLASWRNSCAFKPTSNPYRCLSPITYYLVAHTGLSYYGDIDCPWPCSNEGPVSYAVNSVMVEDIIIVFWNSYGPYCCRTPKFQRGFLQQVHKTAAAEEAGDTRFPREREGGGANQEIFLCALGTHEQQYPVGRAAAAAVPLTTTFLSRALAWLLTSSGVASTQTDYYSVATPSMEQLNRNVVWMFLAIFPDKLFEDATGWYSCSHTYTKYRFQSWNPSHRYVICAAKLYLTCSSLPPSGCIQLS